MLRNAFWVDEPEGPRWKDAIELFGSGKLIVCMHLGLLLASEIHGRPVDDASRLTVSIQTHNNPSTITAQQAKAEIGNAEAGISEIRQRSPEFARLISGRPILYELIDDDGMTAVSLATKDESGFRFEPLV